MIVLVVMLVIVIVGRQFALFHVLVVEVQAREIVRCSTKAKLLREYH